MTSKFGFRTLADNQADIDWQRRNLEPVVELFGQLMRDVVEDHIRARTPEEHLPSALQGMYQELVAIERRDKERLTLTYQWGSRHLTIMLLDVITGFALYFREDGHEMPMQIPIYEAIDQVLRSNGGERHSRREVRIATVLGWDTRDCAQIVFTLRHHN